MQVAGTPIDFLDFAPPEHRLGGELGVDGNPEGRDLSRIAIGDEGARLARGLLNACCASTCVARSEFEQGKMKTAGSRNRTGPDALWRSGALVRLCETFWDAADDTRRFRRLAFAPSSPHG